MQKWKVWLLIALSILGSLVCWALLGRNVWNALAVNSRRERRSRQAPGKC